MNRRTIYSTRTLHLLFFVKLTVWFSYLYNILGQIILNIIAIAPITLVQARRYIIALALYIPSSILNEICRFYIFVLKQRVILNANEQNKKNRIHTCGLCCGGGGKHERTEVLTDRKLIIIIIIWVVWLIITI